MRFLATHAYSSRTVRRAYGHRRAPHHGGSFALLCAGMMIALASLVMKTLGAFP
jgi:hypothetical protein